MTTWTKSKGVLNDHLLVLRTCPSNIGPGPLCLFSLHSAAAAWGLEATQNWSDEHLRFAQEDHSLGRRGGLQISGFPKPGAVSLAGPLAGREVAREPACLTVKKQGFALCFSPTNIYLWCFGCERGIKDTIYILNIASFRVCKSLTLSWSSGWNMNMDERGVKLPRIHSHPHTPVVHKHGNEQASTCRRWLGSKWGKNQFHLPPIACTLFLSWVNLGEQSSRESMGKRVVVYKVTIEFRSRTYIIQSWRCSLISLMTGLLWQGLEKFHWSQRSRFLQKRALPLSLLAASALSDLDVLKTSELIVHCFLDGNIAPFSDPHDWSPLAIHFWVFCLLYLMGFQVILPTKNCNLMDFTGI